MTARRSSFAGSTTPPTHRLRRPTPGLRRLHGLRQHAGHAPPAGAAARHGLRCATGRPGDARRRLPLRPRRRRSVGADERLRPDRRRSSTRSGQDPVLSRRQADRRAVDVGQDGYGLGTSRPDGASGTAATATPCATSGAARKACWPSSRPASRARADLDGHGWPPADGIDQHRHRPRRVHPGRPRQLRRKAQRGQWR